MKKILLPMLLALAILLPTMQAQAADVPGFYQVGRNYLTFTGREGSLNGVRVYGYDCSVDLNENFAEQYMRALVNNYNFRLIGHYLNDYRRGQAKLFEYWIFAYTGSKRVSTFVHKNPKHLKDPYYCHLYVGRSKNWQSGTTHFSVKITSGLTYGED